VLHLYIRYVIGLSKTRLAIRRREELGQTVATSVNYLKNLVTLFEMAIPNYSVEDPTFPRSFDLMPYPHKINSMRLLLGKIQLLYKSKLKKQPQELFERKTTEAQELPDYPGVRRVIKTVESDMPVFLTQLEEIVVADGEIDIAPVKGSPIQKMVSHGSLYQYTGRSTAAFCYFHISRFVAGQLFVEKNDLRPGGARLMVLQTPQWGRYQHAGQRGAGQEGRRRQYRGDRRQT